MNPENENLPRQFQKILKFADSLLKQRGGGIAPETDILDFGSGGGKLVRWLLSEGYSACGVDFYEGKDAFKEMLETGHFKPVQGDPYIIPHEDESFDLVISQNVFEHVLDFDAVVSEIARVTRSGGYGVHLFPPGTALIEGHINVPLAGCIQRYWWIKLWSPFARWMDARGAGESGGAISAEGDIALRKFTWIKEHTNYLPHGVIRQKFGEHFSEVNFLDTELFMFWPGRLRKFAPLVRALPFIGKLNRRFRVVAILVQK